MDFLDDLEERPAASTYAFSRDTQVIAHDTDSESEKDDVPTNNTSNSAVSESSVLEKIKQRLYGNEVSDVTTQVIEKPAKLLEQFLSSLLFTQGLPQLAIEDAEIAEPKRAETQDDSLPVDATKHASGSDSGPSKSENGPSSAGNGLFVDLEDEEPLNLTREDKINALIEKKRQKRLAAEQLEADITHTSLTDEENDLNEHDRLMDSSVLEPKSSRKHLDEIDQFLNAQKRDRVIQPVFQSKITFTNDKFLSAFESDDENANIASELSLDHNVRSSPITSPVKHAPKAKDDVSDEELNILGLINPAQQTPKRTKLASHNPIQIYAQNLKKQLLSSPTQENEPKVQKLVNLDDSESDSDQMMVRYSSSPAPRQAVSSTRIAAPDTDDLKTIPQLSKEMNLMIKQKFSKKNGKKASVIALPKNLRNNFRAIGPSNSKLLSGLKRANVNQLTELRKLNPDLELIEQIENEEEEMGNLLEREMERARNIRKQEKLRERAKMALLGEGDFDADYDENAALEDAVEVPDSEVEESFGEEEGNEDEDEEDDDDDEDEDLDTSTRRARKIVLSEDEEEAGMGSKAPEKPPKSRNDDSWMFGGDSNLDAHEHDDRIDIDQTHMPDQVSQNIHEPEVSFAESNKSYELFQNLKQRTGPDFSQLAEDEEEEPSRLEINLPSFNSSFSQQATQIDATQVDTTSVLATQLDETQADNAFSEAIPEEEEEEEEEDLPSALSRGRKLIRKNAVSAQSDDEEAPEENLEELEERRKIFESKLRRKELRERKKRKEMEKKGLKNLLQGEAEESEDEWHGIGGVDHELSDQANSEDEKMIDNNFNIDLNDQAIRKKFMEEYQIKDRKELEKLMDDVKNHRLVKKAGVAGLDLEFSDEEDELLMAYRRQKLQEQKERLMANKKMQQLSKNERAKAFFESIQDSTLDIKLDDNDDEVEEENGQTDEDDDESTGAELRPKKRLVLEESFVQKQLLFLNNTEDDYAAQQRVSRHQHGFLSDEEDDLQTLRARSFHNLHTKSGLEESTEPESPKRLLEDSDDELMPAFKRPSVVQSFRVEQGVSAVQFSGVTVSKQYKVASGAKASITYMSKQAKTVQKSFKSSRARKLEEQIHDAKRTTGLFRGALGFEA